MPENCDYECALVYPPIYTRCKSLMNALLGPARMPGFERLSQTCEVRAARSLQALAHTIQL